VTRCPVQASGTLRSAPPNYLGDLPGSGPINLTQGEKMTFMDAIKTCFSKYADFNGRAVRSEYWWFVLFIVLSGIALSIVNETLGSLFYLATLLPSIAAAARRLHDTDRSGWMQLIGLIPLIGWLILIYFLAQKGGGMNRFGQPVDGATEVIDSTSTG
jgi:uncharacterized membrane protein YhaH (DUF805 family)